MRIRRLTALLALLAFVSTAATASAGVRAPTGLHGFLLRTDEPAATSFSRTPSFAWNPVPSATGYQLQLATSNTFRDNGILYDNAQLLTPVDAPPLTLPWINGSPHALYARVRAILQTGTTPWSTTFGFDVTPPAAPTPLPSYPGVLRWTPVEGADTYQVWLIDSPARSRPCRQRPGRARVLHVPPVAAVDRQRPLARARGAQRHPSEPGSTACRRRGSGHGVPIYNSTNPAVTNGPIRLIGTVSDVFSDGSPTSSAHELMPAFLWSGNQTLNGTTAELFRVYVFTDSQCLNRVYTSAVIGGPAWAPRLSGPLALPAGDSALSSARASYLGDGSESNDLMYDFQTVTPNEQQGPATPTTRRAGRRSVGARNLSAGCQHDAGGRSLGLELVGSSAGSSSGGSSSQQSSLGPPVDLWDTDWPASGYYWTVIPVQAIGLGATGTTVAAPGASVGDTAVPVATTTGLRSRPHGLHRLGHDEGHRDDLGCGRRDDQLCGAARQRALAR